METTAGALVRVLRGIGGSRHLCLEEGTHASWLYEVLSPHVEEIVVVGVRESRGPSRNSCRTLKRIFKGAATTAIGQAKDERSYRHYLQLLDGGTKPNLPKLTLARQVASIMLAVNATRRPKTRHESARQSRVDPDRREERGGQQGRRAPTGSRDANGTGESIH